VSLSRSQNKHLIHSSAQECRDTISSSSASWVDVHLPKPQHSESTKQAGDYPGFVFNLSICQSTVPRFLPRSRVAESSVSVRAQGNYPAAQRSLFRGHHLVIAGADTLSAKTNSWQPLTEEDRYLLAITLAASFMQLHRTPWISKRWSERDVLFCEEFKRTNIAHRKGINMRHPFVAKTLLQIRSGGRVEPQDVDMGLGGLGGPNELTEL